MREVAQSPPVVPRPVYAGAKITDEAGVGFLLVSQVTSRRFFCPEEGQLFPTHFDGSVRKAFEVFLHGDELEDDGLSSVVSFVFDGTLWKYRPSRPLALKTSRIAALKLEAQWQSCALGELVGEDPIKEVSTLQLLHNGNEGRPGGHAGVEELVEALVDDTNLYKISVWYDGGELFERCPMPERDAKGVFAQILDALKFVHAQGVCHRDISLENVLMDTSSSIQSKKRSCSSRSCSVSSIGSCVSVASSSDYIEADADEDVAAAAAAGDSSSCCSSRGGFQSGDDCCLDSNSNPISPSGGGVSGVDIDIDAAERRNAAAATAADAGEEWIGTPRLCDFGMSVRIPTTETGEKSPILPQGRCGKSTCVAPEIFYDQVFDAHAIDTWSVGTTLFMALLGVQPWEEIGDFKFQAIAEGKNLDVVLEGWKLRDVISDDALDLLQAMLTADPEERLSDIDSILAHPWFRDTTSATTTGGGGN